MGGSGHRGGSGHLPTPLVVRGEGSKYRTLLLLPASRRGSWFLAFLYCIVRNLPQLHMHAVIFSPVQFLCILLLQETFVQVQALQ